MNFKKYIFKYYNRNLTFDLPNLDSPNEPVLFLGFFASWIRIFSFLNADTCGPGTLQSRILHSPVQTHLY